VCSLTADPLRDLDMRLTYRTMQVLRAIAAQPGLSNIQVAERAGVLDKGQISRLLARLMGLGLLENTEPGRGPGRCNAWQLSARGRRLQSAIAREVGGAPSPGTSS
jgi:DNA-binding MarR family transcriptional regulator